MTIHDVVVVGAGPAGACAARVLAEAGARVVLLEKHALPRYKTCGGGVVGRALRGLPPHVRADVEAAVERSCHTADLDLDPTNMGGLATGPPSSPDARSAPGSSRRSSRNAGNEGLRFRAQRERPLIAMVMRDRFDAVLCAAAERAGAEVRPGCAVRALVTRDDRIELETTGGPVVARFVVAADGATSETARLAGWRPPRARAPAVEAEVRVPDADFARLAGAARFDFGPIPAGYGWVFPKRAHLSIGVCTMRSGVNLNVSLMRYLDMLGLTRPEHVEKHGFFIPLGARAEGLVRGRVLLAGDAASLADPVTGEGISAAIESGTLAGRAILSGGDEPVQVGERYDRALATLRREVRLGRVLARLTYDWPRLRRFVFRLHGQALAEGMTDVLMGDRTYASLLTRAKTYAYLLGLRR